MYSKLHKSAFDIVWNQSIFEKINDSNMLNYIVKVNSEEEAYVVTALFMSAINNVFIAFHSFFDKKEMLLYLKGSAYKKSNIERAFNYMFLFKDITKISHNHDGIELFRDNKIGFI